MSDQHDQPIAGFQQRPPLETWITEDGIPCKIQAGYAGIFGHVQLPPAVLTFFGSMLEDAMLAALGIDEKPDDEGWVCTGDHQAEQIWDEDELRAYLPPDAFDRAMQLTAPLRNAGYKANFNMDKLRASTQRLAGRVAQVADRIEQEARQSPQ